VEALFPVFDFSREGRLNFDEVNILLQSVSRGLTKVCGGKSVADEELIDACRRSFDAHNLRYDKQITREQAKRWMLNDVEVMAFVMTFHKACRLPQALEVLADQQRAQLELFLRLGGESAAGASVHEVLRGEPLRQAIGGLSDDDLHSLAVALASAGGAGGVGRELFERAAQAWNAFGLVADDSGGGREGPGVAPLAHQRRRARRRRGRAAPGPDGPVRRRPRHPERLGRQLPPAAVREPCGGVGAPACRCHPGLRGGKGGRPSSQRSPG
ncbi:unnamed protein product, partial [Prorocentrum cordatum]